ncbi:MAG: sugar ABC transporter substrate-binding protein [Devosia sp.]|nr:sugar ABC transporter substrate-binding protein [Devosia sp.]
MIRSKVKTPATVVIACATALTAFVGAASSNDVNQDGAVHWGLPSGYVSPDGAALPTSYPDPTGKPAEGCKIGYVSPMNAIPGLPDQFRGMRTVAERYGCTVIIKDGKMSPQVQVTGIQQLLAQGVLAIVIDPMNAETLAAPIRQANSQNVPVIMQDSPAGTDQPNVLGTASNFDMGHDPSAYAVVEAISGAKPGAKVGVLFPSFPAVNLQYQVQRLKYWADKLGLVIVGEEGTPDMTHGTMAEAVNALIQKHPEIQAIMTFNDPAAEAATAAARSLNRGDILVTGLNGESGVTGLIKSGNVLMTWAYDNYANGEQLAAAAIGAALGMAIPEKVTAIGAVINKGNVDKYTPPSM